MNYCLYCDRGDEYMICSLCKQNEQVKILKKMGYNYGFEFAIDEIKSKLYNLEFLKSLGPTGITDFPKPPDRLVIPNGPSEPYWYILNFNIGYYDGYKYMKRNIETKDRINRQIREIYRNRVILMCIFKKYKDNELFDPNLLKIII